MERMTGIAWNRQKYVGNPLQLDDQRLKDYSKFLKEHDDTVVKLDSRERVGIEDMHPSLVAISWHGPDYNNTLRRYNLLLKHNFVK